MDKKQKIGVVRAVALKTAVGGPMHEVASAVAIADGGLRGSANSSADRGVTLLSEPQWNAAMRELDAALPWHARRANVLLDAPGLGMLIGKRLRIGEVELLVTQETKPCGQMEAALRGLREALRPDCRGGVCCRVVRGGQLGVNDAVELLGGP